MGGSVVSTKTHHKQMAGARIKKVSAASYFETVRRLSSDPQVLVAVDKAEAELKAKHDEK